MTFPSRALPTILIALLALALLAAQAGAARPGPGRLDPRFGDGGVVDRDFGTEATPGRALAAMPGPGGTTLVLEPGRVGVAVARYLPDGRLDPTFGAGGVALDPEVESFEQGKIAPGPGGTILALTSGAISRFTADGRLDRRYGEGGHVRYSRSAEYVQETAVVAYPDGSTVVIRPKPGRRSSRVSAVRYGPTGRRDRTYGHDGETQAFPFDPQPIAAAAAPDGGLVIATPSGEGLDTATLMRVDPDGGIDRSFGEKGQAVVTGVHGPPVAVIEEAGGAIVVGTEGDDLARVSSDGRPDPGFGREGVTYGPAPRMTLRALVPRPGGGVIGVGYALTGRGVYSPSDFAAESFDADGRPDPGFGGGTGYVTTSRDPALLNLALGAALLPDGRLILVGGSGPSDGNFVFQVTLAALEPDGTPVDDFGHAGFVTAEAVSPSQDAVTDLLVGRHGGILAAGHAHGAVAVARFSAAGRLDRSFGEEGTHLFPSAGGWTMREGASLAAAPGGGLLVGPGSSGPQGVLDLDLDGDVDRGFGDDGRAGARLLREALALAVRGDGSIAAFGVDAARGGRIVTLLGPSGRVDKAFGRGGSTLASKAGAAGYQGPLAQDPQGVLAVLGGSGSPLELDPGGRPIEPTDARLRSARTERRLPGEIVDLAFSGQRLIAFGQRAGRLAVTRLHPDGRPDPSFGEDGMRTLRLGELFVPGAVAIEPDGRILLAGVSHRQKSLSRERIPGRATVVRLTPDGSLDPRFGEGGIFRAGPPTTVRITSLALGPGTVTVGGAAVAPGSRDLQMQLLRLDR
jgi:uncharacterized delta-60 repeat protein